jgi:UDP-3-O-[3-hydroxymyristoyl] glucosamine N-acyltransferase
MYLVSKWLELQEKERVFTISPKATIDPTAQIGENVHIGVNAVIEDNVCIGDGTYIGANCVICSGTRIGSFCKIYPNVTIYSDCIIGKKAIIHSGAVIGADGFGFIPINENQIKVPQVGNVVIEDDVEIGANTCIDRSTIGTTLIKTNTKIDNLVQVGHNCQIDEHSILCSQVGLAGSTHIGKSVYLAGQVGVAGHLKIDDNTMVGAQSGVPSSLPTGKYFGSPAISAFEQKKIVSVMKDLPSVVRYIKKMMKEDS